MRILINHAVRSLDAGKSCSISGCGNLIKTYGLCNGHYQRKRLIEAGAPNIKLESPVRVRAKAGEKSARYLDQCQVEGCTDYIKYLAAGMCSKHKQRLDKGQPLTGPIARTNRKAERLGKCVIAICSRLSDGLDGMCDPHTQRKNRIERGESVKVAMEAPVRGTPEYYQQLHAQSCTVKGCSGKLKAKGFCSGHYQQHLDGVDVFMPLRRNNYWHNGAKCRLSVCNEKSLCRGLCKQHYSKYKHYGELGIAALERWVANGCEACGNRSDAPHIDHDHKCCPTGSESTTGGKRGKRKTCGKCVRGALCYRCNMALGLVDDSLAKLNGMITYLTRGRVVEQRREA